MKHYFSKAKSLLFSLLLVSGSVFAVDPINTVTAGPCFLCVNIDGSVDEDFTQQFIAERFGVGNLDTSPQGGAVVIITIPTQSNGDDQLRSQVYVNSEGNNIKHSSTTRQNSNPPSGGGGGHHQQK